MPRSTYIYLVSRGSHIVAAYTVKREMVRYVTLHYPPGSYMVIRVKDGVPNSGKIMGQEGIA